MASTTSKGNYYKVKTKKFYEDNGFTVQITEFMCGRMIPGGRMIYVKKDIFGSDLIAMNGTEIIFVNSKATTEDRKDGITKMKSEGKVEFEKYPFPPGVKRQVAIWLPRKDPIIIDL